MLVGTDGRIRAKSGTSPGDIEQNIADSPLWSALVESPRGMFPATNGDGAETQYIIYNKLDDLPLITLVEVSSVDIAAENLVLAVSVYTIAGLISLFIVFALYFVSRQSITQAILRDSEERYRVITDAVPTGIIVHGA